MSARLTAQDQSLFDRLIAMAPVPAGELFLRTTFESGPDTGYVMEFGVFTGDSIRQLAKLAGGRTVYGFDSFVGLPEPWVRTTSGGCYPRGHFDLHGQLPRVPANVELVRGFFSQSLPPWAATHGGPVGFIHVDSDLYSSAKQVLTILNDRIRIGTVIAFDELAEFENSDCYNAWADGEWRALMEWSVEYDREFVFIARTREQQAAIRILK